MEHHGIVLKRVKEVILKDNVKLIKIVPNIILTIIVELMDIAMEKVLENMLSKEMNFKLKIVHV